MRSEQRAESNSLCDFLMNGCYHTDSYCCVYIYISLLDLLSGVDSIYNCRHEWLWRIRLLIDKFLFISISSPLRLSSPSSIIHIQHLPSKCINVKITHKAGRINNGMPPRPRTYTPLKTLNYCHHHHHNNFIYNYNCNYTSKNAFSSSSSTLHASPREPTYYEILNVPVTATTSEIKKWAQLPLPTYT